jgi:ATP-dependent RNA helicase DeaD
MDMSDFNDFKLSEQILKAIDKLGYEKPSKVQEKVIPIALSGKDIIVKSQTGSGKTAAFGIPLCQKIEIEINEPQAIVLTPTRELCTQIKEDLNNIGRFKKIRCASIYGKQPVSVQMQELKQRVHIIAGTPGRTFDLIERGNIVLDKIKYLIIDEADKMLNMGFIDQVEAIINKIPKERITMLFSATMPEEIESLCQKYMIDSIKIDITPESITSEKINQEYYEIQYDNKFDLLEKVIFIENPDSAIIFCRTKENVDILYNKMKIDGFLCSKLHGGMLQSDRTETMGNFKRGEFSFLIATDVAARGIDIDNLTHIFNYDIPVETESYIHRIGRTGRAGKIGKAITFVTPNENRYLHEIEEYIDYKIPQKQIPTDEAVEKAKIVFRDKGEKKPKIKRAKETELNKDIMKLHINGGKRKKIRASDIVGALSSIEGISSDNIGIIDIQDGHTFIDILDGKGQIVYEALKHTTIKGKLLKVSKAAK